MRKDQKKYLLVNMRFTPNLHFAASIKSDFLKYRLTE